MTLSGGSLAVACNIWVKGPGGSGTDINNPSLNDDRKVTCFERSRPRFERLDSPVCPFHHRNLKGIGPGDRPTSTREEADFIEQAARLPAQSYQKCPRFHTMWGIVHFRRIGTTFACGKRIPTHAEYCWYRLHSGMRKSSVDPGAGYTNPIDR